MTTIAVTTIALPLSLFAYARSLACVLVRMGKPLVITLFWIHQRHQRDFSKR